MYTIVRLHGLEVKAFFLVPCLDACSVRPNLICCHYWCRETSQDPLILHFVTILLLFPCQCFPQLFGRSLWGGIQPIDQTHDFAILGQATTPIRQYTNFGVRSASGTLHVTIYNYSWIERCVMDTAPFLKQYYITVINDWVRPLEFPPWTLVSRVEPITCDHMIGASWLSAHLRIGGIRSFLFKMGWFMQRTQALAHRARGLPSDQISCRICKHYLDVVVIVYFGQVRSPKMIKCLKT